MLSSFLHNCQQSLRTDRHVYLLCDLEHRFLLSFQAPCQLATGLQEKRSLPLSKAQKNVDKTRLRLSCWASNLVCTGQILFIRHRANRLLLCPTAREPGLQVPGRRGCQATEDHSSSNALPPQASLGSTSPHRGQQQCFWFRASVLTELYTQFGQPVFIQCSVFTSPEGGRYS